MADKKISQLTNLTGANLAENDEFVLVDTSADETKAITFGELKTAFDTGTGFVRVTGDTMTGDLSFNGGDTIYGDNDKAIFGAGSDLQIYHDGGNSLIEEAGVGNLIIRGSGNVDIQPSGGGAYMARFAASGAASLYNNGSPKLATTSTGVDVTGQLQADSGQFDGNVNIDGTITSDGLTVDGDASVITLNNTDTSLGLGQILARIDVNQNDASDQGVGVVASIEVENRGAIQGLGRFNFKTGGATSLADRMSISEGGDISFYEDTGTTPKFFWDASAESLGIGTSSPTNVKLQINGSLSGTAGTGHLAFGETTSPFWNFRLNTSTADLMLDRSYGGWQSTPVIAFDRSSGNVGIGTSSPESVLHIASETNGTNTFTMESLDAFLSSNQEANAIEFQTNDGSATGVTGKIAHISENGNEDLALSFSTFNGTLSEAMRIDSSGNVGIGTSSPQSIGSFIPTLHLRGGSASRSGGVRFSTIDDSSTAFAYFVNNDFILGTSTSDPVLFRTNNTEAMRIDSSGNVGIGTTSTGGAKLAVVGSSAGNGYMYVGHSTVNLLLGAGGALSSDSTLPYVRSNTSLGFATGGGAERMRIDSSGHAIIPAGVTLGTAAGVYNAANTLDDYEEGTWTPTQGTFGTWTSPTFDARYTKIGNVVNFSLRQNGGTIDPDGTGKSIGGLPFAVAVGSSCAISAASGGTDKGSALIWTTEAIFIGQDIGPQTSLVISGTYITG